MPDFKNYFWKRIFLTNTGIKDIMKVIQSLENREILLKERTRKITSQER